MKLSWDKIGERYFEAGVSKGVLYQYKELEYKDGVAWNGLISVKVGPTGSTAYDGKLYRNMVKTNIVQSYNEYNGKISCYTYPDEFESCIGYEELIPGMYASQQDRPLFALSFVTGIGNDIDGFSHAYKIHLVYNCLVVTNDGDIETISDEMKVGELIYDIENFPVEVEGLSNPSSEIILDSRKLTSEQLTLLEETLYGTATTEPRLPYPDELVEMLSEVTGETGGTYPSETLYPDTDLYPETES